MTTASNDINREILDRALDGLELTSWTKVKDNAWGGFDITARSCLIRVTRDDMTWNVILMTLNGVERGRQTFDGVFADPAFIGGAVGALL